MLCRIIKLQRPEEALNTRWSIWYYWTDKTSKFWKRGENKTSKLTNWSKLEYQRFSNTVRRLSTSDCNAFI